MSTQITLRSALARTARAALVASTALTGAAYAQAQAPSAMPTQAEQHAIAANVRETLSRFGNFVVHQKYGEVWIPSVTPQGWHPYLPCHWKQDSKLGWFYDDRSAWGSIVHHYGRWTHDADAGWFWVPGAEFSPGWVVWRTSPEYIGWAPMPPDEDFQNADPATFEKADFWTFMETPKFGKDCEQTAIAGPDQIRPLLERTTFVRNIEIVNGIAVWHFPTYIDAPVWDFDVTFSPWPAWFFAQTMLDWNWMWNNVVVTININPVDCPPQPFLLPPPGLQLHPPQPFKPLPKLPPIVFNPPLPPLHLPPPAQNNPPTPIYDFMCPDGTMIPKGGVCPMGPIALIPPPVLHLPPKDPPKPIVDYMCPDGSMTSSPASCPPKQIVHLPPLIGLPPVKVPTPDKVFPDKPPTPIVVPTQCPGGGVANAYGICPPKQTTTCPPGLVAKGNFCVPLTATACPGGGKPDARGNCAPPVTQTACNPGDKCNPNGPVTPFLPPLPTQPPRPPLGPVVANPPTTPPVTNTPPSRPPVIVDPVRPPVTPPVVAANPPGRPPLVKIDPPVNRPPVIVTRPPATPVDMGNQGGLTGCRANPASCAVQPPRLDRPPVSSQTQTPALRLPSQAMDRPPASSQSGPYVMGRGGGGANLFNPRASSPTPAVRQSPAPTAFRAPAPQLARPLPAPPRQANAPRGAGPSRTFIR